MDTNFPLTTAGRLPMAGPSVFELAAPAGPQNGGIGYAGFGSSLVCREIHRFLRENEGGEWLPPRVG